MNKLLILCLICAHFHFAGAQDTDKKLNLYKERQPLEKVFLHTDRTVYEAGSSVWFSAYMFTENSFKGAASRILYVELLDPQGSVVQIQKHLMNDGKAFGNLNLGNAAGGIYTLKAYTNYMANFGDSFFFSKKITVHHVFYPNLLLQMDLSKRSFSPGDTVVAEFSAKDLENIPLKNADISVSLLYDGVEIKSRLIKTNNSGSAVLKMRLPDSLPMADARLSMSVNHKGSYEQLGKEISMPLKGIRISFLPEGGYALADAVNRIAFKALNVHGKASDFRAEILDSNGKLIGDISSSHMGMGSFMLKTEAGMSYYARIIHPYRSSELIALHAVQQKGMRMLTEFTDENVRVLLRKRNIADAGTTLLLRFQNDITGTIPVIWQSDSAELIISRERLRHGINSVILLNGSVPVAERLLFNDRNPYRLIVKTDDSIYSPRDKVKLELKLEDSEGKVMNGRFSLSVLDTRSINLADDKQDNILSYALAGSELRGLIEEPAFYFTAGKDPGHKKLDLVMLTHGWRRYKLEELVKRDSSQIAANFVYDREKTIVSGRIYDYDWAPLSRSRIKIQPYKQIIYTNEAGFFRFEADSLSFPLKLRVRKYGVISEYVVSSGQIANIRNYAAEQRKLPVNYTYLKTPVGTPAVRPADIKASANQKTIERYSIVKSASRNISLAECRVAYSYGGTPTFAGSRTDGTRYYVDGVPMIGTVLPDFSLRPSYNYNNGTYYYYNYQYVHFNLDAPTLFASVVNFYSPVYENGPYQQLGDDKRIVLHWAPDIKTRDGKAELSFYTNDQQSSFLCEVQGVAEDGTPLMAYCNISNRPLFDMAAQFPRYMLVNDSLGLSVRFENKSTRQVNGTLALSINGALQYSFAEEVSLEAQSWKLVRVPVRVSNAGTSNWLLSFKSDKHNIQRSSADIEFIESRFRNSYVLASAENNAEASWRIKNALPGSVSGELIIESAVLSQLISAAQSMIREPHGCFEQVSSSNYPNIAIIRMLEKSGSYNAEISSYANILQHGYEKLAAYETREGGFEWYGQTPPNEGLSAYGLLQFHKMKDYVKVDRSMVRRTLHWLESRRLEDGSYKTNQGRYGFAGAGTKVTTAYVSWVLSEIGEKVPEASISILEKWLTESKDNYYRALLANIYANQGKYVRAAKLIRDAESCPGGWDKIKCLQTLTYSDGNSMKAELLSFYIMAAIKCNYDRNSIAEMMTKLQSLRSGGSYFGTTQATALAYEAITMYYYSEQAESGYAGAGPSINCTLNGSEQKASLDPLLKNSHRISFPDSLFNESNHFSIRFEGKKSLIPYSLNVQWYSDMPLNKSDNESVRLDCIFLGDSVRLGESVRLNVKIENLKKSGIPQTVALIGIPAGLEPDIQQLKQMQEKKLFDYYEHIGEYLILYWREMAPSAVTELAFDLEARISGKCYSPPSVAYLYYTPESKFWTKAGPVNIQP